MVTSSARPGDPKLWNRSSTWSLQNDGIGANGVGSGGSPRARARAAWRPARLAVSVGIDQCSTRRGTSSKSGLGKRAMSPTATTRSAPSTARALSVRTPSLRSSPLPSSHSVLQTEPTDSTTTSAGNVTAVVHSDVGDPLGPAELTATPGPITKSDALVARGGAARAWRVPAPSTRFIGAPVGSMTVTSWPSLAQRAGGLAADEPGTDDHDPAGDGQAPRGAPGSPRSCAERAGPASGPARMRRRGRSPVATTRPSYESLPARSSLSRQTSVPAVRSAERTSVPSRKSTSPRLAAPAEGQPSAPRSL